MDTIRTLIITKKIATVIKIIINIVVFVRLKACYKEARLMINVITLNNI